MWRNKIILFLDAALFCAVALEGCLLSDLEQFCWFKILTWHWRWHSLSKEKLDHHADLLKIFTSSPVYRMALHSSYPTTLVIFYHEQVCHAIKAVLFHLSQRKVRLGFSVSPMNSLNAWTNQTLTGVSSPLQHMGSVGSFYHWNLLHTVSLITF